MLKSRLLQPNPDRVAQLRQFIESSTSNARRIANAVLDDRSARQKLLDEAEAEAENCEACDDTPMSL